MRRICSLVLVAFLLSTAAHASDRARNVILFIGDAGGIPTLHAASIYGHRRPQALFIQHMPHLALMDTSAADRWVTDSAAAMSAIVTGRKTKNGVISQSADAVRGTADGAALQTILEHAEQRGLSTGVITNTSIADATPAACYAHANDRKKIGEIFAQLARPRFGDGPEVVVGAGRAEVLTATRALGIDIEAALRERGYALLDSPAALGADLHRFVALTEDSGYDPVPVLERAIGILSRNRRGFFLMVEWDMHTNQVQSGLDRVLTMDALVRRAASLAKSDTLVVFTADHSFDLRVRGGSRSEPLLRGDERAAPARASAAPPAGGAASPSARGEEPSVRAVAPNVRVEDGHTGEQVLVAAQGPGAERVHGFIENTDLFAIMMAAYGWEQPPAVAR